MSSQETITPAGPPPRLSMRLRLLILLALCAGTAVLAWVIRDGIHTRVRADSRLKQQTLESSALPVSIIHPKPGDESEELVLPGNAQAYVATPIYARTNGYLRVWYFDIGARVKAGELLAEIETPEVDRQLDQARADLATAQANYDLARTTASRYQTLFKTDSVSQQDVDDKVGDLHARKAMLDSASFNLRRLEETQRFQKIYAPFAGVVTARNVDIGALVSAGGGGPGKELFDMAATNRLRVYINVPQANSREARPGNRAYLTLAEFPGRRFPGDIVRTADAIDPASRTLLTEVDVDNSAGELLPGAFVSVHIRLASRARAVVVPVTSLIFRAEGLQVGVVRTNKAALVPVTIGHDYGNSVEIVSGLDTRDQVIDNPSDSLTAGAEVRIVSGAAE